MGLHEAGAKRGKKESYDWFWFFLLLLKGEFLGQSCSVVTQNQLLLDTQENLYQHNNLVWMSTKSTSSKQRQWLRNELF